MTSGPAWSIAFLLPPTQSFFMAYSAPAVLASRAEARLNARTLVADTGIHWLNWSLSRPECPSTTRKAITKLRDPESYTDMAALRRTYDAAEDAIAAMCSPFSPERVDLSGVYYPRSQYQDWQAAFAASQSEKPHLFDEYIQECLVPQLRSFGPDIVALSLPFDWMIFPTMRLTRLLRGALPHQTKIILGGHAVERLWQEEHTGFFDRIEADFAAVGDGDRSLRDLAMFVVGEQQLPADSPLMPLAVKRDGSTAPTPTRTVAPRSIAIFDAVPNYPDADIALYLRPEPILSVPVSEGCYYGRCTFCSRQRRDQSVGYVERRGADVARAMLRLGSRYHCRQFIFAEDIVSHRFMRELSGELDGTDTEWFAEASFKSKLSRGCDAAYFRSLHSGGARLILNGLESASPSVQQAMGCPTDLDRYTAVMMAMDQAGIVPYVTMVFGYPTESRHDVELSAAFMRKHIDRMVFACSRFWAIAGTPLMSQLRTQNSGVLRRASVLTGGYTYSSADTLPAEAADQILHHEVPGLFEPFAHFLRTIPTLMYVIGASSRSSVTADQTQEIMT